MMTSSRVYNVEPIPDFFRDGHKNLNKPDLQQVIPVIVSPEEDRIPPLPFSIDKEDFPGNNDSYVAGKTNSSHKQPDILLENNYRMLKVAVDKFLGGIINQDQLKAIYDMLD